MDEQTHTHTKRVIVVDNDIDTTVLIAELLKSEGFVPLCYPAWLLSVACIEQAHANLLILELGLGDPSAELELIGALRKNCHTRSLPVIVDSTNNRLLERLAHPLRELGCMVLPKPFDLDDFFASVSMSQDTGRSQMPGLACQTGAV